MKASHINANADEPAQTSAGTEHFLIQTAQTLTPLENLPISITLSEMFRTMVRIMSSQPKNYNLGDINGLCEAMDKAMHIANVRETESRIKRESAWKGVQP